MHNPRTLTPLTADGGDSLAECGTDSFRSQILLLYIIHTLCGFVKWFWEFLWKVLRWGWFGERGCLEEVLLKWIVFYLFFASDYSTFLCFRSFYFPLLQVFLLSFAAAKEGRFVYFSLLLQRKATKRKQLKEPLLRKGFFEISPKGWGIFAKDAKMLPHIHYLS